MSTDMSQTVLETAIIVRIQLQQAVRSVHRSLTVPLVRNMSGLIDLDSDTLETCTYINIIFSSLKGKVSFFFRKNNLH